MCFPISCNFQILIQICNSNKLVQLIMVNTVDNGTYSVTIILVSIN